MKCPTCGNEQDQDRRADHSLDLRFDVLLRAAQDVVNSIEPEGSVRGLKMRDGLAVVDQDAVNALKAVVQEISDDAVRAIEAIQGRPIVRPGGVE